MDGLDSIEARSYERQTIPSEMSLAAETDVYAGGKRRLKAGCSQDWPPHKQANLPYRFQRVCVAPG